MQTLRALLAAPLDPDKTEATACPWWFIFDPRSLTARAMSADAAGSYGSAAVTGPFFSRESARAAMEANRHNHGPNVFVYCASGHRSRDYQALLEMAKADGPITDPANPTPFDSVAFVSFWNAIQKRAHETATSKGWWEEDRGEGERIALIHSELSEALEGLRHGNPPSDHIPEFTAAEEEYADAVIRIMDNAAAMGHRVAEAIIAKMVFNAGREHKHGGKRF